MKVLVCGGRTFSDYKTLKDRLDKGLGKITEIIHGCARGADSLADKWARENNIPIKRFPANWDLYGKKAGTIRNQEMLKYNPDFVIAFHGGVGTQHMVRIAQEANVKTWVQN